MSDENQSDVSIIKGRPRKYPYPSSMVCTVTGKTVKTNPTQFETLMKKYGKTQEELIASYVSREGKQHQTADAKAAKAKAKADAKIARAVAKQAKADAKIARAAARAAAKQTKIDAKAITEANNQTAE